MNNPAAADGANHGTHVAGTIAAMNNNGKGVSGIAGGSGADDGVRLMSCATMNDDGRGRGADYAARAITYACNNGAVICQNSWGYSDIINWNDAQFSSLKTAIGYFVDYAGMDETGEVQVGPMAGGLVVFAAGNEGYYQGAATKYPAADSRVVAVASIGADYRPAYYSSYGTWVDVSAPGGDPFFSDKENPYVGSGYGNTTAEVLSTIVNGYGLMSGTSMACPHVSGVAALGLSYASQLGVKMTAETLKEYLIETSRDIDSYLKDGEYKYLPLQDGTYKLYMQDYRGKIGEGLVDADALLKKCGVIRAENLEDAFLLASAMSKMPRIKGNRVGIISNAGGLGTLTTDALVKYGFDLPELSAKKEAPKAVVEPPKKEEKKTKVSELPAYTDAEFAALLEKRSELSECERMAGGLHHHGLASRVFHFF
jgi:hypothetical protein